MFSTILTMAVLIQQKRVGNVFDTLLRLQTNNFIKLMCLCNIFTKNVLDLNFKRLIIKLNGT